MNASVWVNGELRGAERARELTTAGDLRIAADGGARHLWKLGLKPHVVIGDMDSLDHSLWENDPSVERIAASSDKDKTDAELAVDLAFERGCYQVTLFAATGGRLDHTLGNVSLVAKYPGRVAIVDGDATLVAIDNTRKFRLHGTPGSVVSLIPFGRSVEKVTSIGLRYPIEKEDLTVGTRGISNRLSAHESCTCVAEGLLLAYAEQKPE
mgnify:CR=1 FL=1